MLAFALLVVAGCGEEQVKRDEPFTPSKPPAGWVEERMKLKDKGNQPGPPQTTQAPQ